MVSGREMAPRQNLRQKRTTTRNKVSVRKSNAGLKSSNYEAHIDKSRKHRMNFSGS